MKSSPVESYSDPPLTTGDEKLSIFHIVILSRGRQYANEDRSYLRGLSSSRPPSSDTQLTLLDCCCPSMGVRVVPPVDPLFMGQGRHLCTVPGDVVNIPE